MRNTVVMILLAILAAATWLASWQRQEAAPTADRVVSAAPLGYFLGARFSGFDEQGRVTYRVFADRLDELADDQRLQLTGVEVEYRPSDDTPAWSISAATATFARDGSQLDFRGGVEVRSQPDETSGPWTVRSDALRLWPETSKAESREAVEIRAGDWKLLAMGLRMDLKGETLELESQVHGSLLP